MWLYALCGFVTCKLVWMPSICYNPNFYLSLFVFSVTFAEWHWQFISICNCFIRDQCLSFVKLEWLVRETQNLLIAVGRSSNPLDLDEFLLIPGLISIFFLMTFPLAFLSCFC